MAYERVFRERALEYLAGHTIEETANAYKVTPYTLWTWGKLLEETGSLERRPLQRSFKKIDPEKLRAYVAEHPDAYIHEIAANFSCGETAVRKALKRLKITRKKRRRSIGNGTKKNAEDSSKK